MILDGNPSINSPKKFILKPETSRQKAKLRPEKVRESEHLGINALPKPQNLIRITIKPNKLAKKMTACKTFSDEEKEEERAKAFNKLLGLDMGKRKEMKMKREAGLGAGGLNGKGYQKTHSHDLDIAGLENKIKENAKNLLGKVFKGVK